MDLLESWADKLISGVRASGSWKRRTREELLAHLNEARARLEVQGMDEEDAIHAAIVQMGAPEVLRAQLQATVPTVQRVGMTPLLRRREDESEVRMALRYALVFECALITLACATFAVCCWQNGYQRASHVQIALVALMLACGFPFMFMIFWSDVVFYRKYFQGRVWSAMGISFLGCICAVVFFAAPLAVLGANDSSLTQVTNYLIVAFACVPFLMPLIQLGDAWCIRKLQPWRRIERYSL